MEPLEYLSKEGLLYVWQKIKLKLSGKVDKIEGKGLSTNDLTDELKQKILDAGDSSFSGDYNDLTNKPDLTVYENKIETIKVNGTTETITDKSVDISVPTNNNQLTNGAGYQTSSEVNSAITSAISGVTQFDYQIVESLPEVGVKGTIYLISNNGTGTNIYDEYIWITDKFEKFGTAEIDLSEYVKYSSLEEITNAEIDAIFAE